MDQLLDEEKDFFKFLDEQLQMVDHFYKGSNGLGWTGTGCNCFLAQSLTTFLET